MPTGYTADIEKGISFKEYAMGPSDSSPGWGDRKL